MKDLKEKLKELISQTTSGEKIEVVQVIDFRVKDHDDRYGIGDHYIVNCLIKNPMDPKNSNVVNEPIGVSFLIEAKFIEQHDMADYTEQAAICYSTFYA